jgi:hypothetical protein
MVPPPRQIIYTGIWSTYFGLADTDPDKTAVSWILIRSDPELLDWLGSGITLQDQDLNFLN